MIIIKEIAISMQNKYIYSLLDVPVGLHISIPIPRVCRAKTSQLSLSLTSVELDSTFLVSVLLPVQTCLFVDAVTARTPQQSNKDDSAYLKKAALISAATSVVFIIIITFYCRKWKQRDQQSKVTKLILDS